MAESSIERSDCIADSLELSRPARSAFGLGLLLLLSLGCSDRPQPPPIRPEPTSPTRPRLAWPVEIPTIQPQPVGATLEVRILPITEWSGRGQNLCWAAAAQILTDFADGDGAATNGIEQCRQAGKAVGGQCCVPAKTGEVEPPVLPNSPLACDAPGRPRFDAFGFSAKASPRVAGAGGAGKWFSWPRAVKELESGPFAASEKQPDKRVGHMVVVRGWAVVNDVQLVLVFNPRASTRSDPVLGGTHEWYVYDDFARGEDFEPGELYYRVRSEARPRNAKVVRVNLKKADSIPKQRLVGGGGATSATPEDALSTGLELLKIIGASQPRLLGLSSALEAADLSVDVKQNLPYTQEGDTNPRRYFSFFVKQKPRGAIVVKQQNDRWYAVHFWADGGGDAVAKAVAAHTAPGRPAPSLVYVPALRKYLVKTETGYFAIEPAGTKPLGPGAKPDFTLDEFKSRFRPPGPVR